MRKGSIRSPGFNALFFGQGFKASFEVVRRQPCSSLLISVNKAFKKFSFGIGPFGFNGSQHHIPSAAQKSKPTADKNRAAKYSVLLPDQ